MPRVKVQAKKITKANKVYKTLYVTVPSVFSDILRIKEGDYLEVTIADVKIGDKLVRAIVYYKP